MKRCPKCQRTYPDDSPGFCVNDGAQLVSEEAPAYDPQKTILASQPPPPPPPQQYNPAPPPVNQPPQPQAPWPPPPPQQQGQWGGGYYQQPGQQYAAPYGAPPGASKALTLTAFILGVVSGILGLFMVLDYSDLTEILSSDTITPAIIAAFVTGVGALVIGILALISRRQRSKVLAIIGMVLAAASIGFCIYLEAEYGFIF
jgi:hypothetical protein